MSDEVKPVEPLKCGCGYVYKTPNRKKPIWDGKKSTGNYQCKECGIETIITGMFSVCHKCKAYVPYGTKLCVCGFKRSMTRGEAKQILGKVQPDMVYPAARYRNSSKRPGTYGTKSNEIRDVSNFKEEYGDPDERDYADY